MIQVSQKNNQIHIENSDKTALVFSVDSGEVILDGFDVNYPGEYEKWGILGEVKEYNEVLFYKFLVEGKHVAIVTSDSFEIKEEILSFFGDIDVLLITGTKSAVKIFENIEAKVVFPYGEGKDIFLNTVGHTAEAVKTHKIGADINGDSTEFVNLA